MVYENKLPSGYTAETVSLGKDKKLTLGIYGGSVLIAALAVILAAVSKNIGLLFDTSGIFSLIVRLVLVIIIIVLSILAQELIKCALIGKLTGKPARLVRGKMSAYVEYKCWLDRRGYLIISLAPAAAICLVSLLLALILPDGVFWQCYCVFVVNLAGMSADAYIAFRLLRLKGTPLAKNEGYDTLIAVENK